MRILLCLFLVVAAAGRASASDGLSDARAAQALLGGGIWSRIVRIENSEGGAWHRRLYPDTVYAVVFELSDVLWFYTDTDGTQSLSVRRGTLAADRAEPGPLFLAISRGFVRWSWVAGGPSPAVPRSAAPPNGCFVQSVATLHRRMAAGAETGSPRLLSYYVDTPLGLCGHTVVLFGTRGGMEAIDPELSERPVSLPSALGEDPRLLSAYLRGSPVAFARTLSVAWAPSRPESLLASSKQPAVPAG